MPAPVHSSETEDWSVEPPQPLQLMDAPRRTVCPIVCGTSGMVMSCGDGKLINGAGMNQLPAVLTINKTVTGPSGVTGMPVMTGIGGHPGPPEVMMKGGPRGHHGHILLGMSRKSTSTRARLRRGTEVFQRRPGVTTAAC